MHLLDGYEQAWRDFVRKSNGRCPTHLLVSPNEECDIRDALSAQMQPVYGFVWVAADGKLRIKGALVVSNPNVENAAFVWHP